MLTSPTPRSMSYLSLSIMVGMCCGKPCALIVPFVANGSYDDPNGDGRTQVRFGLSGSPFCGISVARVLRGDLDGLEDRDDLAVLNPRSGSMRLRIEVSNLSLVNTFQKLTYVNSWRVTNHLCARSAAMGIRVSTTTPH